MLGYILWKDTNLFGDISSNKNHGYEGRLEDEHSKEYAFAKDIKDVNIQGAKDVEENYYCYLKDKKH